jgi:hypothetical protein
MAGAVAGTNPDCDDADNSSRADQASGVVERWRS